MSQRVETKQNVEIKQNVKRNQNTDMSQNPGTNRNVGISQPVGINPAEIDAFLAIVEQGSLSRAAEVLYLTQSALSSRLELLEKETRTRLVNRKKGIRRVELTDAGRRMIPVARKWKALYEETRSIAMRPERSRLSISAVQSIQAYLMGPVYDRFFRECPNCDLNLMSLDSERTYQMMEKGELEAGLIANLQYSRKVAGIPLFEEPMYFVCGEDASYSGTVHPSELSPGQEVYMGWYPDFARWHTYWFGGGDKARIQTDSMQLMERFLAERETWMILPLSAVRKLQETKRIKVLPMQEGPGPRITYLLTNDREKMREEFIHFLLILKEHLNTMGILWLAGDCQGILRDSGV